MSNGDEGRDQEATHERKYLRSKRKYGMLKYGVLFIEDLQEAVTKA